MKLLKHKMRSEKVTRQSIGLPETLKEGLDKMATAFGMTQNDLINLAVTTMVVKYETEGMRILVDLITPSASFVHNLHEKGKPAKGRQRQDSERVYEETLKQVLYGEMDDLFYSNEIL